MKYKYRILIIKSVSNDGARHSLDHVAQCKSFVFWKTINYSFSTRTESVARADIQRHKNTLNSSARCGVIRV
jgi:hypothetical protein